MASRMPNLLVIGAMKAGTTTLCEDLNRHPEVWFPEGKEPDSLSRHLKGEAGALDYYRQLYGPRHEQILGDGSTGNSKMPLNPNTAKLAAEILPADTRIIYITRDPIVRIERHIAHEIGNGMLDNAQGAVFDRPEFLSISAYEMQLSYWLREFDEAAILRVSLEDYLDHRVAVLTRVFEHLQLDPAPVLKATAVNANRGKKRRSAHKSWLRHILHSRAYTRLRERLPRRLRRRLAELLLPKATEATVVLGEAERAAILIALASLNRLEAPAADEVMRILSAAREGL